MKVTNKFNLPEPLVKAVTYDLTNRTGWSVTDLIQPPRITQLLRRHWDELETDASDRIWVLLGQSVHYILARYYIEGGSQERTITIDLDGTTITGRPDLWTGSMLDDYKLTSAWSVVFEPRGREDWHKQLNIYRWMIYKAHKVEITTLRNVLLLRDWQKSKSYDYDYPKVPAAVIKAPVWPYEKTEKYVRERLALHQNAETLPDAELPLCTAEETWSKATTWAIMRAGRKSAVKVCKSKEEALNHCGSDEIVERPGQRVRCEEYCDVKAFCVATTKEVK